MQPLTAPKPQAPPQRQANPAPKDYLAQENSRLHGLSAEERLAWALHTFADRIVLSSSFGVQAAVSLHMVTRQAPEIPVIFLDTGYHFPETYRFVDVLTERLQLNLQVFRADISAAWQEARYGKRWENGVEGIEAYNRENKVEPMQRAMSHFGAEAWISGVRRDQTSTRQKFGVLALQNTWVKIHPIIDWSDYDIYQYLKRHDLPYHPLWDQGYVSIGDTHTTRKLEDGLTEEETRFFGLKRECGLHSDSKTDFSI